MDLLQIAPIAIAGAGVLVSGLTAALVSFAAKRSHDEVVFIRTKAEELYLATEEYGRALMASCFARVSVAQEQLTWDQSNDLIAKRESAYEHGGHAAMVMLVGLYFPSLKPKLDLLIKARDAFNASAAQLKHEYTGRGMTEETKSAVIISSTAINSVVDELKSQIISTGRHKRSISRHSKAWHRSK